MSGSNITVGELIKELKIFSNGAKIRFAGGLRFNRLKRVADDEVFVEFEEVEAWLEESFKKRYPNVKVVFINNDDVLQGGDGPVSGPIDVSLR